MSLLILAVALALQSPTAQWSEPRELFAAPGKTWVAIDADAWGRVHVFWTGKTPETDGARQAIYHTHLEDEHWSAPAVLFAAPQGHMLAVRLDIRSTADGWLHLVWSDRSGIQMSRAPCNTAAQRGSWEEPRRIADAPGSDEVQLATRGERELHLVVTRLWGDENRKSGVVEYLRSADSGVTWSPPQRLSDIAEDPVAAAGAPRLFLDGEESVHVVWDERSGPHWLGDRIVYARSRDDGDTWDAPRTLAQRDDDTRDRRTAPSIAAAAGELHVVYTCRFPARRCQRISADGGAEWSAEQPFPFGNLVGLAEWDALLADAEGNLHFVTQMRTPRGMYYATKAPNGLWSEPLMLDAPAGWDDAHAPDMALSLGNRLQIVWNKTPSTGDIIYAVIQTSAQAVAPAPAPPLPASPPPHPPLHAGRVAAIALLAASALVLAALVRARRR